MRAAFAPSSHSVSRFAKLSTKKQIMSAYRRPGRAPVLSRAEAATPTIEELSGIPDFHTFESPSFPCTHNYWPPGYAFDVQTGSGIMALVISHTSLAWSWNMVGRTYQDAFPSDPLFRSSNQARAAAAELLNLEYFEAEPATMPPQKYDQHHILINLNPKPYRVENWRGDERRDFLFKRHEIVLTPAGMHVGWRWHSKAMTLLVTLEPAKFENFARRELSISLTSEQLQNTPQFLDEDIATAGCMMLDALRLQKPGAEVMYECYARVFLVKLIHKYGLESEQEQVFSRSFTATQYREVLHFIEENFARRILLEDLATVAGLSTYHFSRLFKQTVGQSPHQFLLAFRVEKAKQMMSRKNDAILFDIALSCGFSDQAHLSRVFKQITGQSPGSWRNTSASENQAELTDP